MTAEPGPASRPTIVLDPKATVIRRDRHGGVKVRLPDGTTEHQVRLVEAFPVTRRRRFVALYAPNGEEMGVLRNPKHLDPESAEVVLTTLDRSYFMSRIKSIERIEERYGLATWHVITDRGPRVFEVRSRAENVWWLGASRILIKDPDGNRYEIHDLNKLDSRSRVLAELHL